MTQKILGEKEVRRFQEQNTVADGEPLKEVDPNEVMERFRNQQVTNLSIKEAMALELAADDLPDFIIRHILHLEDEPPF